MTHPNPAFQSTTATVVDREIILERLFDAPRRLVYQAWTEPKHLEHWWGPDGFSLTIHEINVKPGGVWSYTMHGPDGTDYVNKIVYREVVASELLRYGHGDENGEHFQVKVKFEEQEGKTLLTMRMLFPSAEALAVVVESYGAVEGGKQTLGRLAQHLEQMQ